MLAIIGNCVAGLFAFSLFAATLRLTGARARRAATTQH